MDSSVLLRPCVRSFIDSFAIVIAFALLSAVSLEADQLSVIDVTTFTGDSFFVLEDGSLWVSGGNENGKHGDGTIERKSYAEKVVDSGVSSAETGRDHSLILMDDSSLWGAGSSNSGQLGLGDDTRRSEVFAEIVSSGVVAINAKFDRSYFIKDDGSLWGMGEIEGGTQESRYYEPVQLIASGVTDVSTSLNHTLILLNDGSLWVTGDSLHPALGDPNLIDTNKPAKVLDSGVVGIAAGMHHSVILKSDGSVWTAGTSSSEGALGDKQAGVHEEFTQVMTDVKSVHAGRENTMIIKNDGSVWDSVGPENFNLIFQGDATDVETVSSVRIIQTADGSIWGYGSNIRSYLGGVYEGDFLDPAIKLSIPPAPVALAGPDMILVDSDNSGFESALLDGSDSFGVDGSELNWVWEWEASSASTPIATVDLPVGETEVTLTITDDFGHFDTDTLTITVVAQPHNSSIPLSIVKGATGGSNIMVLLDDGSVWGRGINQYSGLGNGTSQPVDHWQRLFVSGVADIALSSHSLILMEDGSLYGFGENNDGQLGNGTTTHSEVPIQIFESGVSRIDALDGASLILMDDGSVWAMGQHRGNGDPITLLVPTKLFDSEVEDINASATNYFVVRSDGSAWGSGSTSHGTMGNLNGTQLNIQIFESGISSIRGGTTHSLFLTDQGSLWGLGRSRRGELGLDGGLDRFYEPLTIFTQSVAKIEAFVSESFAILNDGSLWVSGRNSWGQLGTGNTQDVYGFTKVIDSGVLSVSAATHTLVLKEDKTLWAMGLNQFGPLGHVNQIGEFVLKPTLIAGHGKANAGPDVVLEDTDNDGSEEVLLNAYNSGSPWNIASSEWSGSFGTASGNQVLVSVGPGTNPITLTTTSVDGAQSSDTANIVVLPDDNPSGTYYQWLLSHFDQSEIDSWTDGIFFADPDLDKISNLDEWVLNFDPTDPASGIDIHFLPDLENNLIELNPASENFNYRLWSSQDLKSWVEISPESTLIEGDTLKLGINATDGPFIRVSIAKPNLE